MSKKTTPPSQYNGPAPDDATAAVAVDSLRAQLGLISGNLDSLDSKAALLPPFLVVLASLVLPGQPWTATETNWAQAALVLGSLSVLAVATVLLPGDNALGPNARESTKDLGGPVNKYRVETAMSLVDAVEHGTNRTHQKAFRFKAAAVLAAATILCVILARFT